MSWVALLPDPDEGVIAAERAAEDAEAGLFAEGLDHQDVVGVVEVDPWLGAAGLEPSPDGIRDLALEGGRVELALEAAPLEADEERAGGEAVEEALGGLGERGGGAPGIDPHRLLDRHELGERTRQEGVAPQRVAHP